MQKSTAVVLFALLATAFLAYELGQVVVNARTASVSRMLERMGK